MLVHSDTPNTELLAITAADAAKLTGISERHWWAMQAAGRIPRPFRLGRATRWNLAELRAWLDVGAPARDKWEAIRERGGK